MIALQLFAVFFLVGLNAFFAMTEFSLVAVRLSRVRQLVEKGNPSAKIVESLLGDIGRVVSGVQVGITLASLMLGYLGEVTLASILTPMVRAIPRPWAAVVAHSSAFILAFGLLTVLQVVLGELVPKSLSLARAERVALLIARPFRWFLNTFRWAIDLLDGVADNIVGWLGVVSAQSHTLVRSAEELQVMVQQARDRGLFPAHEAKFIQSAMELGHLQVREVMVPRPDVHALPANASFEETMSLFAATQRSRLPVYEGTLDHILGFIHIKDMIWILLERARGAEEHVVPPEFELRQLLHDALIVPETKPASELLVEFRTRRTELAMVVDEFGSILGLVTLEDIIEQMVGEIHDEFDVVERPVFLPDGTMIIDGAINVRELQTQYGIVLPEDSSYETVGGFVLSQLGFIPRGGESFEASGYRFTVMEMERRRISRVKINSLRAAAPAPPATSTKPSAPARESSRVEPARDHSSEAARETDAPHELVHAKAEPSRSERTKTSRADRANRKPRREA